MGCIRTSETTMEQIGNAIDKYGSMESITILNNKTRQDNSVIPQPYLNQEKYVDFVLPFNTTIPKTAIDNTYL